MSSKSSISPCTPTKRCTDVTQARLRHPLTTQASPIPRTGKELRMSTQPKSTRKWWALALIAAAQFMVIMDTSIIGVALPQMQSDLGFSQEGLTWVFNAYVIAFGGLLLLGGRLSDLFGARRVFSAGWL